MANPLITINLIVVLNFAISIQSQQDTLQYRLPPNQLGLPIFNFCNKYQLLIDTGSDELWLADASCRNCQKTLNLCPQLKQSRHQIDYFLGDVKGDFTALNTCVGITQIFCAKEAHFFDNLNSNGIVGINGNSTGKNFITKYLEINQIKPLTISFLLLNKQHRIIFGAVPQKYKKGGFGMQSASWSLNISGLAYDGHSQSLEAVVGHLDSGSNMLVVPESVYKMLHEYIKRIMQKQYCRDESESKMVFKCQQAIDLNQTISFMVNSTGQQKQFSMNIRLVNLLEVKGQIYYFQIEKTSENKIIFGYNTFRGYIVSFGLNGKLHIVQSRFEELSAQEQLNYSITVLQYVGIIAFLCGLASKVQELVDSYINKKIVI